MNWIVLKAMNTLFEKGKVPQKISLDTNGQILYLKNSLHAIEFKGKKIMAMPEYRDIYLEHYNEDYQKYLSFLNEFDLVKPQSRYEESNIQILMKIHALRQDGALDEIRHQILEANESLRGISPLNVYKALLKMALSVIPQKHVNDYKYAMEYIISNKKDDLYSGFAMMTQYDMPFNFQLGSPTVMLFRKRDPNSHLFTHLFVLYALNSIFQIYIPFNIKDRRLFIPDAAPVDALWCPPLLGTSNTQGLSPITTYGKNLNSTSKVHGEIDTFKIPALDQDFETVKFTDKETCEITEKVFDGKKVIGIDLMMRGD